MADSLAGLIFMPHDSISPPLQDTPVSPRIVQGEYFRFNADLPRGSHLPASEAELALDQKIRDLEQASGVAWGEGRNKVAAEMVEQLKSHSKFDAPLLKTLSFDLARHHMVAGGSHDQESHVFFDAYRQLVAEVSPLREQVRELLAARVGAPEFECMQQLDRFDRPQSQTAAFQSWFKNSKVSDTEGRPLIAFHGSGVEIESFKTSFKEYRQPKNQNWAGQMGAWFAAPSSWSDYEAGNAEATAEVFSDLSSRQRDGEGAVIYPVYLSILNPYELEGHDDFMEQMEEAGGVAAFRRMLEDKGHDGLVIEGCYSDGDMVRADWVAFHASQIKSAIGNSGAFCKDNPDMCDRRSVDLELQQRATQAASFVQGLGARKAISP